MDGLNNTTSYSSNTAHRPTTARFRPILNAMDLADNDLQCRFCGEEFNRRDGRERHELQEHDVNVSNFICYQRRCTRRGLGLKSEFALHVHLRDIHQVAPEQNVPPPARRSSRIASAASSSSTVGLSTRARTQLPPVATPGRGSLRTTDVASVGVANNSSQSATVHRRPSSLHLPSTRTAAGSSSSYASRAISIPSSESSSGSVTGSTSGATSGAVTPAASNSINRHPSWSVSTFVPTTPNPHFNGLPSSTTSTPLPSPANPPSVSASEMFLAPPADRVDQGKARAGPSEVALGKQTAHYDNSDDRDDENAQVANATNSVARHARGVIRALQERHERDMREMREEHEREKEVLGQVVRMYRERNAKLERERSGADI
ncbi:hypothetical protein PG985_013632 [Apiospora marii]|uniref:uncharacterized protein n=1 Tax=Apiospora marii TaxID=335849 RepID=UPI00312F9953